MKYCYALFLFIVPYSNIADSHFSHNLMQTVLGVRIFQILKFERQIRARDLFVDKMAKLHFEARDRRAAVYECPFRPLTTRCFFRVYGSSFNRPYITGV